MKFREWSRFIRATMLSVWGVSGWDRGSGGQWGLLGGGFFFGGGRGLGGGQALFRGWGNNRQPPGWGGVGGWVGGSGRGGGAGEQGGAGFWQQEASGACTGLSDCLGSPVSALLSSSVFQSVCL